MTGFERRQARRRLDALRSLADSERQLAGLYEQMTQQFPGCDDYPAKAVECTAKADAIDAEIQELTGADHADD